MKIPRVPLQGNAQTATIAVANLPQSLVNVRSLVRSVTVVAGPGAQGTVTMSLGPNPVMPNLTLTTKREDGWIDLSQIQIRSTVAGDTVVFQTTYAP